MIENILRNTTKLVSQFLKFKCIFHEFYKLGLCCCELMECSVGTADDPPGKPVREERSAGTKADTDGQSTKMMDSLGKPQTARL